MSYSSSSSRISLVHVINNRGPSIEPCGTPDSTVSSSDSIFPNLTVCFLLFRYDAIHDVADSLSPRLSSFLSIRLCANESKALLRSRAANATKFPLSICFFVVSISSKRLVVVEWYFL